MADPFFYIKHFDASQHTIQLDEDTSRHIVQVLRMKAGNRLNLTDGKGHLVSAEIITEHKKHCEVKITGSRFTPHASRYICIAISLLKNTSRFEWFLEKATEIGISRIIPLICERTEKEKFRYDRMQGICISAMLQSQQAWLTELKEPMYFDQVVKQADQEGKFIAHCIDEQGKEKLSGLNRNNSSSAIILIGPEGDFTPEEVHLAREHQFEAVTLGDTRLRSETAGLAAAILAQLG